MFWSDNPVVFCNGAVAAEFFDAGMGVSAINLQSCMQKIGMS